MAINHFSIDLTGTGVKLAFVSRSMVRQSASRTPVSTPAGPVTASDPKDETQPDRWKRLMLAAQAGQQREYAMLLQEAAVFIRAIARRHHRNTGLVEDVVQETLTSIHRMRQTHEPGRPVEPWIAAIAKARSIDVLRRHTRISKRETGEDTDVLSNHPDRGASTESRLVSESVIADAMANLTDAQREAVRLLKIEELSLAEAASVSGLSVQALKSALHRAMQNLRTSLKGGSDA
jgi:RNA polymerase sigma-70 factor (ECF subfamily)